LLGGAAIGIFWDEFAAPETDSSGTLPPKVLPDYDDLVAFARAALIAAGPGSSLHDVGAVTER
jgi:hypothetical protein